jgi:hypothetical protein
MTRFVAVPDVPQAGLTDWQVNILTALKDNVELLTGGRRETGASSQAITRGSITVNDPPAQTMTRVTATGAGFTISGVSVPSLEDYNRLLVNVQQLANDVAVLRSTVAILLAQLRG